MSADGELPPIADPVAMPDPPHDVAENTILRGEATEALVVGELKQLGFSVFTPVGGKTIFDVIADDGDQLYRVQIKTGRLHEKDGENPYIQTKTHRSVPRDGDAMTWEPYPDDVLDVFVVYEPETRTLLWVPRSSETPKMNMRFHMHYDRPSHKRRNYVGDYLLRVGDVEPRVLD